MERFAGRYALLRSLGQGGMGTVHLALDLSTGTECALKRLHPRVVGGGSDALRHEFELLARVRHPAVVGVYEMGVAPDGTTFYTMEYVPGVSADQGIPRGDWRALCFAAAEVAHGLEALHGAGVLHGDLKPSNLLVITGAEPGALPAGVRILDFGLAALLDRHREGHRGTPGYAAPEVVRGEMPEVSSDLYSLGATLYALAAGRVARSPSTRSASGSGKKPGAPPSAVVLDEAGVPAPLGQLILRLMAPSPGERPRDAREVRAELERIEPAARRSLTQRFRTEIVVGRERELARLERWLARSTDWPRVVMLAGGPGMGKTALLGELQVRCALSRRVAMRFSCAGFAATGSLAVALCRRLAAEAQAESTPSAMAARALALLEPGELPASEPDMALLADAAVGWSRAVAQRGAPPIVMLDDRERLDPLSLALVRRLVFHPGGGSIRWVWAGRTEGSEPDDDDRMLLDAGQAERLELRALDRTATERLVSARLHSGAPRELLEFLVERAGGHPGLLVELLRAVAECGALQEREEGLAVHSDLLSRVAMPDQFETSLLERLAAQPEAVRRAASALAVRGRPSTGRDLATLTGRSEDDALERLRAGGLASRDEEGRFTLSPPALATAVLDGLDAGERRRWHRAALDSPGLSVAERFMHLKGAGDTLAALDAARVALASGPEPGLVRDAAALAEAEAPEQAGEWLERLGSMLMDQGRFAAAIPHLERAFDLEPGERSRFERMWMLSTCYLRSGRPADVERVIGLAVRDRPPAREHALLLCNEAARLYNQGQLDLAREVAEQALALAIEADADDALGYAALTLGSMCMASGDLARAGRLGREAEEAFARAQHASGRARALGSRATLAAQSNNLAGAERLYREALDVARASGLRLAAEELHSNLGVLLLTTGRWSAAAREFEHGLRLALEDGRPNGILLATTNLALLDGLSGRAARALRRARTALRMARARSPRLETLAWRAQAQAHRIAGRTREAERSVSRALARATRLGFSAEVAWSRVEYAKICAQSSRWKEVAEVTDHSLDRSPTADPVARVILGTLSGRAALRRRDFAVVDQRLSSATVELAERPSPYAGAHITQLLAERALVQGRLADGLDLARTALAAFTSLPAVADRASAALEFARLAIGASAAADAPVAEWLQEAAAAFERLGDHPGRERALALTVDWLHRTRLPASTVAHERDLLQSVSRLLDSLADVQVLARRAMQMAVEHLDAERGVLLLTSGKSGELTPVVEHGAIDAATRDQALSYSHRAVEKVARSGGSLLIGDAPTNPEMLSESVVGLGLRSILCVPLYGGGNVAGAVYVDDSRRPDAFTPDDRGLLEGFAHLMAVAIEKSRGHEEVQRANEQLVGENLALRREARARFQPHNFVGTSSVMQGVLSVVERAAQTATTVLITGENGTGKELIARILHHSGRRHLGPFIAVNCGAIPETLLESELFGILDDVATGVRRRDGRFVQANGGTLFLDEIGAMPLEQQVALLSALSSREITPVGGGKPIKVDVRIIAATNSDLRKSVDEGAFREDLFYRLNVIPIEVPPLRERKSDIPSMAHYFVAQIAQQHERAVPEPSPEFIAALMQSDWPGNVRQLQSYIERIMAMTPGGVLHPRPLPDDLEKRATRVRLTRGRTLADVIEDIERRMVGEALERADGNQSRAARELGMTEQSLRYRLRKYALEEARHNRRVRRKRR